MLLGDYQAVNKLKIAIICENYPPDNGGIAESARRLVLGLRKFVKIHVVHFQRGNPDKPDTHIIKMESSNLSVHEIAPFINGWTIPPDSALRAKILSRTGNKLAKIFSSEQIDIIHGFGLQNAGLVAARVSHLLGLPLIQSVRGNDIGRNSFDGFRRIPLAMSLKNADMVVAVNFWVAELLKTNFPWISSRVRVVNNGIAPFVLPNEVFKRKIASSLQLLSDQSPIIGFVGTLREKKGPYIIKKLAQEFISTHNGRLLIIGDIDLELFKQMGWSGRIPDNDFVTVRRARNRKELFGMISLCNWLVFPSLDDGMANGLLEAMACARPVICSPIFSDVITDGKDGFIVSPFNPSTYLSICDMLWNNPGIRNKIGIAARQRIEEQFNADIERNTLFDLYYEIMRQKRI